jgi:TolB-like protein/DNA-binding winged helix-turn-helix (wHTH) protein/phosphoglycolate phosphatase-like HAD superfamily hydrolase
VSPDPASVPPSIRFGEELELDRSTYQLRRSGRPVRLERIPLEILMLLTERPGQLVTREQIAERIWGKGAFLDVDNSINGAVRKIRQVLEDDPEQPRFIQTITGRGYRFVAPVLAPADAPPEEPRAGPPAPDRPRRQSRGKLWLAGALALALLVGTLIWSRGQSSHRPPSRVMLAVLPFQNLTGDEGQEYFSDGLTEEMITQVGNRDPAGIGVIARASVMHFKHTQDPPERVGRELGAQYLLLGSVRRDASTVRVTAELIRARDHARLWAHQYDRQLSGLLTLQDEIAREITDAIQSSLGTRGPTGGAAAGPAPAADAYDLYLRGQFFFNKRTDADIRTAASFFEQAVQRDSGFARGWAALADADVLGAVYSIGPPQKLVARARSAALEALALDPSLAEAHTALALIVQNHDWNWEMAEREFRHAIALNPNYATAHHWYAEHLMWRGRFEESLQESERARQLDPLSLIIAADNGAILYFARRYDQAIARLRSVRAVDPTLSRTHLLIGVYADHGMFDQALAEEERWRPLVPAPVHWSALAYIYGHTGRTAEGRHAIQELLRVSEREPVQARVFAWSYAGVQDTAQTLAWLEKAYAERSGELVSLKVSPAYDFLRGKRQFQRLLERVGFGR